MESQLVVFHDGADIVQMFVSAENEALMEIPGTTVLNGIVHLMAAYYVLDVEYPKVCKSSFFQDIMDKPESLPRPVRYNAYIKSLGFLFILSLTNLFVHFTIFICTCPFHA